MVLSRDNYPDVALFQIVKYLSSSSYPQKIHDLPIGSTMATSIRSWNMTSYRRDILPGIPVPPDRTSHEVVYRAASGEVGTLLILKVMDEIVSEVAKGHKLRKNIDTFRCTGLN